MKFNSQICTSRSQGERLLSLGLKKETADMTWHKMDKYSEWEESAKSYEKWVTEILPLVPSNIDESLIPAWSLHRLIELRYGTNWISVAPTIYIDRVYDDFIDAIEDAIKEGYFNEEYLNEEE